MKILLSVVVACCFSIFFYPSDAQDRDEVSGSIPRKKASRPGFHPPRIPPGGEPKSMHQSRPGFSDAKVVPFDVTLAGRIPVGAGALASSRDSELLTTPERTGIVAESFSPFQKAKILVERQKGILPLLERYLQLPEFFYTKSFYDEHNRGVVAYNKEVEAYNEEVETGRKTGLKKSAKNGITFFQEAVIPQADYIKLLNDFIKTYKDTPYNAGKYIQKAVVPQDSQIIFMGDLHGNIQAFVRMLLSLMARGFLDVNLKIKNPDNRLVFLGDFVDYGAYGADTLALVMRLRVVNPDQVLICRGNHEESSLNRVNHYGFHAELEARYGTAEDGSPGPTQFGQFLGKINTAFSCMPLAIFLKIEDGASTRGFFGFGAKSNGFIQCCHGGLDPNHDQQIARLLKSSDAEFITLERKPGSTHTVGWNFQWCDFTGDVIGKTGFQNSEGRGLVFDIDGTRKWIGKYNIKYVFRGHQDMGYACKNLIKGCGEPMCLVPVSQDHLGLVEKCFNDCDTSIRNAAERVNNAWLRDFASSLDMLKISGFPLGSLPPAVGPVFTFTNASSTKRNYDEGYGVLDVFDTWEESRLRYVINRHEIFQLPKIESKKNLRALGIPCSLMSKEFVKATIHATHYLPRYTAIDYEFGDVKYNIFLGIRDRREIFTSDPDFKDELFDRILTRFSNTSAAPVLSDNLIVQISELDLTEDSSVSAGRSPGEDSTPLKNDESPIDDEESLDDLEFI